jgi:hypothetical protein
VIRLYAITAHPGPPLPESTPLRRVAAGGLAAICGPGDGGEVTPEHLWRHEQVVESLMQDRDLLPVRYGTQVPDEAAAAQALTTRHQQLCDALEFVRGAVELAVRVLGTTRRSAGREEPSSGRAYLRGLVATAAAGDAATKAVHEPLARLARSHVLRPVPRPGELLVGAYLVARGDVDRFAAEVAALERATPALTVTCTGPWPPYSFVER